jgi:signal transduction histidine kinase
VRVWVELYPETRVPGALHVQDTGIGIPVDRLDKIFSAFEQVDGSTRRRHTGTGLGLAISRALCEIMGFDLRVQSEVGKGSTFTILFHQQESPGEEAFAGAEPVSEREDG